MYINFFPIAAVIGDLVSIKSYYKRPYMNKWPVITMIIKGPFDSDQFLNMLRNINKDLNYQEIEYYVRSIPRRIYVGTCNGKLIYFHQNDILERF